MPTVEGYVVDAGEVYGPKNGQTYGWSVGHSDAVFDRDANEAQLLDTLVGVKQDQQWELAVPNGTYAVTVGVGDAIAAGLYNVWVEGQRLYNYTPHAVNEFSEQTVVVAVADGNLTVGVGDAQDQQTRLNYIRIVPATAGDTDGTTPDADVIVPPAQ